LVSVLDIETGGSARKTDKANGKAPALGGAAGV